MKHGSIKIIIQLLIIFFYSLSANAENKISTSPLINLNELKPSFEEVNDQSNEINNSLIITKKKKKENLKSKNSSAKLIGLDKITAKTSEININLGETKKFGPLEIKILKCGKILTNNLEDNVAYLQVKDTSENDNEKVFIFNGWTFSSNPALAPFDHAIYDLQLLGCNQI
tara:strand:- start:445 stop:957 length:513 start_codon:yes stop_codon:yes gene_type:complete